VDELYRTWKALEDAALTPEQEQHVRERLVIALVRDTFETNRFWAQCGFTLQDARDAFAPERYARRDLRIGSPIPIEQENHDER
jgi:hypothetical protein